MKASGPLGFHLERGRAILQSFPFLRYVKRLVGKAHADRLVGYYAPDSGAYCVAVWQDKLSGRVVELAARTPGDPFTRGDAAMVKFYFTNRYTLYNRQRIKKSRERARWRGEITDKSRENDTFRKNLQKGRIITSG